jgi:hypothetical protein
LEVICGGDFNCVLDVPNDRSGAHRVRNIGAKELQRFIEQAGLVDPGAALRPDDADPVTKAQYTVEAHTYFQAVAQGQQGSARLDRFYIGINAAKYVRGVVTEEPLCRTDHRAVLLELHSQEGKLWLKKRAKMYPPPAYVTAATRSLNQQAIYQLTRTIRPVGSGDHDDVDAIQGGHHREDGLAKEGSKGAHDWGV